MKNGTLKIIKSILDNDETLSDEDKSAIIEFCKAPTARLATTNAPPVKYLTPNAVAEKLGVSLRTVQRWISSRQLPSTRIGGSRRIPSHALEDLSAISPLQPTAIKSNESNGRNCTTAIHQGQDVKRKAS